MVLLHGIDDFVWATGRHANSIDFYIEFKFKFSLFYEFEFEFYENLSSFFQFRNKMIDYLGPFFATAMQLLGFCLFAYISRDLNYLQW